MDLQKILVLTFNSQELDQKNTSERKAEKGNEIIGTRLIIVSQADTKN